MPELPEVEIATNFLNTALQSDKIVDVDTNFPKLFKNTTPEVFAEETAGFVFRSVKRKGKYIVFNDAQNKKWIVAHLGMTGAFFISDSKDTHTIPEKYRKHLHITFSLESGRHLYYCDIRKFGDFRLFSEDPASVFVPFLKMGPDPLLIENSTHFYELLHSKLFAEKEIKPSLLDSRLVAGVGNIYACEALFGASIHPSKECGKLSLKEASLLYTEIISIFRLSIENGEAVFLIIWTAKGRKVLSKTSTTFTKKNFVQIVEVV